MAIDRSVPLVRANGLGPLPAVLEQRAGERALWSTFEQEGLPVAVLGAPQTPVPLGSMIAVFERCARLLGDRTFGVDVGFEMAKAWGYGVWGMYGAAAPTLGQAIERYCRTFRAHAVSGRLELVQRGVHQVWRCVGPPFSLPAIQHADHLIGPMILIAREYLGSRWTPKWIEVSYPRDADAHLLEDRLQIPIRYGHGGTGLAFAAEDLLAPRVRGPAKGSDVVTLREVVADLVLSRASEPARSVSAIVALRLLDGQTDIDGTARMAGASVRHLQRMLGQEGYTYREVIDAARRARALSLLRESERPILEVAMLLGYEDHASFSRAFRRWMGCTPSEFRAAHGAGREPLIGAPEGPEEASAAEAGFGS
ncbi:AraC family transcriptional regulator [Ancylobacter sp. MQZ15Z-1]|uniref:AraC family transcriptional regulator n=1 Tax=Ancylobacter mangrovi TaxID=2972472 RepID=A0A9X2T4U2_9HYPH|nr:AraC family transcriptional regulator [Ancylobacter mangrovi]MCS0496521.1 AraC family transcriptional regulator [Ancylobacter mangrovi]